MKFAALEHGILLFTSLLSVSPLLTTPVLVRLLSLQSELSRHLLTSSGLLYSVFPLYAMAVSAVVCAEHHFCVYSGLWLQQHLPWVQCLLWRW